MTEQKAGPPGGRVCPTCGLTRWEAKQADGWVAEAVEARTREIVEALRERAREEIAWSDAFDAAANHIERTFLSPDNPEGNA